MMRALLLTILGLMSLNASAEFGLPDPDARYDPWLERQDFSWNPEAFGRFMYSNTTFPSPWEGLPCDSLLSVDHLGTIRVSQYAQLPYYLERDIEQGYISENDIERNQPIHHSLEVTCKSDFPEAVAEYYVEMLLTPNPRGELNWRLCVFPEPADMTTCHPQGRQRPPDPKPVTSVELPPRRQP